VIDVAVRQLLHLLLGDVEMDAAGKSGHTIGGESHFLVTPQMPIFEKYVHVGYLVRAGVDGKRTELPDLAVGGMDVAALFLLLGREEPRNEVHFSGKYRAGRRDLAAVHDQIVVVRWPPALCDQLYRAGVGDFCQSLFCGGEIFELRLGVAEPDFTFPSVNMIIQQNKPC
jgi:hypothetical protein